jgi:hypothetical protein
MATAPIPGRNGQTAPRFRITIRGDTLEIPAQLPIGEKFAVRTATGVPYGQFFATFDEDSLCVLWWLARRHNGEPRLSWQQHLTEWPTDLTADDLNLEEITDDNEPTDDPGKSVPA